MKILHLHNTYRESGGEDTVVRSERVLLRDCGHDVVSINADNPSTRLASMTKFAVAVWNPAAASRVRALVDDHGPDIAHVHNTWFALTNATVHSLKSAGCNVVMTLHNYRYMCSNGMLFRDGGSCELCVGRSPIRGVRYRCYRGSTVQSAVMASAIAINQNWSIWSEAVDRFLVHTDFARRRFLAAGLPPRKLLLHQNFADDVGARELSPSECATILFVGRMSPEKGISTLLDVWSKDRPPFPLRVIGDGPELDVLRRRCVPNVEFVGRCSKARVQAEMKRARALVVPSLCYEGQPAVVVEAFSAGLPVVASGIGGLAETVAPLGQEWLVKPESSIDWTEVIDLLSDDENVDRAGRRARRLYEQVHHPMVAADRLVGIYSEVVGGGRQ